MYCIEEQTSVFKQVHVLYFQPTHLVLSPLLFGWRGRHNWFSYCPDRFIRFGFLDRWRRGGGGGGGGGGGTGRRSTLLSTLRRRGRRGGGGGGGG